MDHGGASMVVRWLTSGLALLAAGSVLAQTVIGQYPTTSADDSMHVRCTVTADRHLTDCENLSLAPEIAKLTNGGRDKSFDAHVERWAAGRTLTPGVQEFVFRFKPASHLDGGSLGPPGGTLSTSNADAGPASATPER